MTMRVRYLRLCAFTDLKKNMDLYVDVTKRPYVYDVSDPMQLCIQKKHRVLYVDVTKSHLWAR